MLKQSSEIELKFDLDPKMIGLLKGHPLLDGTALRATEQLVSVYFDTDTRELRKAGLSLRVRHAGERRVQGLKATTGSGIFVRSEWEREIDSDRPNLAGLEDSPLVGIQHFDGLGERLQPIFSTRIERTSYMVAVDDAEIELVLDVGELENGSRSEPICEVELELKDGEPIRLLEFAQRLGHALPLQLSGWSKAERGYTLEGNGALTPIKAADVLLSADMDAAVAFQVIGESCISHFTKNRHVLQSTGDLEALHQMRIALRRLRSAITLFQDMLADGTLRLVKDELRLMAGVLAEARELDVFICDVVKPAAAARAEDQSVAALLAHCERRREDARREALCALDSDRFRRGLVDVFTWIKAGDWTTSKDEVTWAYREQPILSHAMNELERLREKVINRGRKLRKLDPRQRHKLRAAVKQLRYGSEFFASVFPKPKKQAVFLRALEALQDELGHLNDIVAAQRIAASLSQRTESESSSAVEAQVAFIAGSLTAQAGAQTDSLVKAARDAYHVFADAKPYWR